MGKDSPKDLKVRTASAIVMIAVAGSALWVGGWVFTVFVALIAAGLLWEWWGLISRFNLSPLGRTLWMLGGVVYIGGASENLIFMRTFSIEGYGVKISAALLLIVIVVWVDVGAYLAGRFIGGAKILPTVSPNKTWAGFLGGVGCSSVILTILTYMPNSKSEQQLAFIILSVVTGVAVTVVAQVGDFFESWMKRKASVKDSGSLVPGHGGLFDRLDGVLAVAFCHLGFGSSMTMLMAYLRP